MSDEDSLPRNYQIDLRGMLDSSKLAILNRCKTMKIKCVSTTGKPIKWPSHRDIEVLDIYRSGNLYNSQHTRRSCVPITVVDFLSLRLPNKPEKEVTRSKLEMDNVDMKIRDFTLPSQREKEYEVRVKPTEFPAVDTSPPAIRYLGDVNFSHRMGLWGNKQ